MDGRKVDWLGGDEREKQRVESILQQWKLGFELIELGRKSDWAIFFREKRCVLFWIFFSGSVNWWKMNFMRVIFDNKGC